MPLTLDGYRLLRSLRATRNAQVMLAERESDGLPVVVKAYVIEGHRGIEARVEHEFALIRALDCKGVVRALALERSGDRMVLILERHAGVDLARHTEGRPMAIPEFLRVARAIAEILAEVHVHWVIHRDIKPSNILIDPATGEVALADFGISVLLESERAHLHDPALIEGTLPYVAPEQTGRTGHEVDFRSDLYSLGVTFYELLTGRRPFVASSPLELIHAHLARRPDPPVWLRPELPKPLSDLVLELLEKAPERRYQSARGLAADLAAIAEMLARGEPLDDFELGRFDVPSSIHLPHQLYGRERELELLGDEFRAAALGGPRLVVLRGPAGIGKTALLGELIEPVLGRRGHLIRGKFDEGAKQPLEAIVQALSGLADQLLTSSDAELAGWRARLLASLGTLAEVVRELVPKFDTLLGELEPVAVESELGAAGLRNRMWLAIARVLAVVARPEHPLVLALDDLQWADVASGELLAGLLTEPAAALLIVGTARAASEVGIVEEEVLAELLELCRINAVPTRTIEIGPLGSESMAAMLSVMLGREPGEVRSLVEVLGRKTGNNPFFVQQFLLHLVERGLLWVEAQGWSWDPAEIEAAELPADSLAMMSTKLDALPDELRELAMSASVLGVRFDAELLEAVLGRPIGAQLQKLADEGLIAPRGRDWVFGHDRIREAAYAHLNGKRRRELHLAIGKTLLGRQAERPGVEPAWLEIAEQLDRGHGLVPLVGEVDSLEVREALASVSAVAMRIDQAELHVLAELNGRAGLRALATGAPRSAVGLLRLASALREVPAGESFQMQAKLLPEHALAVEIEIGLGEALSLVGEYALADRCYRDLLGRQDSLTPSELATVAIKRNWLLLLSGEGEQALRSGCEVLRRLGLAIPARITPMAAARAVLGLLVELRASGRERMRGLAPVEDPRASAAMDAGLMFATSAYIHSPELFVILIERQVDHLLRYGGHTSAPLVLANAGLILAHGLGRRDQGRALIELARELAERGGCRLDHRRQLSEQVFLQWERPYRECLVPLRRAAEAALEAGDIEGADYCESLRIGLSLISGVHLRQLEQQVEAMLRQREQRGTADLGGSGKSQRDLCRLLLYGPVPEPDELDPLNSWALGEFGLGEIKQLDARLLGALALVVFGRHRSALQILDEIAGPIERTLRGLWYVPLVAILRGLASTIVAHDAPAHARRRLLRQARGDRRRLRRWARQGGNCAMQAELLNAELLAVAGESARATASYVRASELAEAQRLPMFEALIAERMAALAMRHGFGTFMHGPLLRARERYQHWGAFAKVAELDRQWPMLVEATRTHEGEDSVTGASSPSEVDASGRTIDMDTLFKTSQAIAADIRLDEVVARVLAIAVENAGAERAVLILPSDEGLVVAAESDAEALASRRTNLPLSEAGSQVPASLLHWVERTRESVVLAEASADLRFAADPYMRARMVRSVLCLPIVKHSRLVGLLYLENKLSAGTFTDKRLKVLGLLMSQAASALENARLYEALRTSEVRWRSLVERLPDVVAVVDRVGRIEFINHMQGERQEVLGTSLLELLGEAQRGRAGERLRETLGGRVGEPIEVEAAFAGRSRRWWSTRFAPIAVDGRVERVIVVATDVTDRRQAERDKQQLEAQLRQQQKLESIGTLASGVAHEINNPIQGIMNYAELIAASSAADAEIREFADEIEHETRRVAAIVRNLLAFSRQESEKSTVATTLSEIVEGTLSLVRAVLRKDQIVLRVELADDLPELECRPQQIQQVIMNLVTNARDALNARWPNYHDDKRIDVVAHAFERAGVRWVRLSVADRGGGIPSEVVPRIFDPFFTTKGRDQGTGLGLAVSHGIVSDHGGDLRLDNEYGVGATFHVELPCRRIRAAA
ncbi:protein kinase domain-containing protein [Nannocystaceae bacterium ST9]